MTRNVFEALLILTYHCNKHCHYCFNENTIKKVSQIKYDIHLLADKLLELGVQKVSITGGEPALCKDLPEIVGALKEKFQTSLFTNGFLFEKYSALDIAGFGLDSICVSIDPFPVGYPSCTYRDQDGLFFQRLEEFYNLKKRAKVTILSTFTNNNIDLIPDFLDLPVIKHADEIFFQPLSVLPKDKLFEYTLDSMLPKDAIAILDKIEGFIAREDHLHTKIMKEFFTCKESLPPCPMGNNHITIRPDCSMYACPHNPKTLISPNMLINAIPDLLQGLHKSNRLVMDNNCLSSRCICLYSHLIRKFIQ